ncbi:hypothetical protein MD537_24805, partial [Flavihumibacter sediminis]|nr:hypothetical protein [Flavihumibacter sediminis]
MMTIGMKEVIITERIKRGNIPAIGNIRETGGDGSVILHLLLWILGTCQFAGTTITGITIEARPAYTTGSAAMVISTWMSST